MPNRSAILARAVWWGAFALVAVHIFAASLQWDLAARAVVASIRPAQDVPLFQGGGSRIFLDNDPYYWLTFAREMVETGRWRVRFTHIDNVPFGRQVHWSQSISWLLLLFGGLRRLFTGEAWPAALENAAVWVNPFILVVLMLVLGVLLRRKLGALPAALFALIMATQFDIGWNFHALRPDHQSLHVAFMLSSFVLLVLSGAGLVACSGEGRGGAALLLRAWASPDVYSARRYLFAAGVLGGLGLWTGATMVYFCMLVLAVGALFLFYFMPSYDRIREQGYAFAPEVWRVWGWAGALTSLAFYLIEYAPNHLAMRLEVNHPVYSLAWLCLGEALCRVMRMRSGARPPSRLGWLLTVAALAGAALPVLLAWLGPPEWHHLRAPEMRRFHNFIFEFYTFSNFARGRVISTWFNTFGVLPFSLLGALALARSRRVRLDEWAAVWWSFFLAMVFLGAAYVHVRWISMCAATNIWLMLVVLAVSGRLAAESGRLGARLAFGGGVVLLLAQAALHGTREQLSAWVGRRLELVHRDFAKAALMKLTAQRLGAANTNGTMRLLCEPDLAGPMYYFGRIPTVTSYYWENLDGLRAATDFLADTGEDDARRVARERGLTHVMLPDSLEMAEIFTFIRLGRYFLPQAQVSLAGALTGRERARPKWLVPDLDLQRHTRAKYIMTGWMGQTQQLETYMLVWQVEPQ